MSQVEYEYKSMPGVKISVPAKYARKAAETVEAVLARPMADGIMEVAEKNPGYVEDDRIFRAMLELTRDMPNQDLSLARQDRLFLEVCVYEAMRNGYEGIGEMTRALFTVERSINERYSGIEGNFPEDFIMEDRYPRGTRYIIKDPECLKKLIEDLVRK
jgi:hypothetical protein